MTNRLWIDLPAQEKADALLALVGYAPKTTDQIARALRMAAPDPSAKHQLEPGAVRSHLTSMAKANVIHKRSGLGGQVKWAVIHKAKD